MMRQIKNDFRYCIFSKLLLGMAILFISTTILTFYMNYETLISEVNAYEHQIEFYQECGTDVSVALQDGYTINESQNGKMETISNPIAYHYEMLSAGIYSISSQYAFSQLCEGGLLFFPILSSFFGLMWAAVDLKNKTLRNKVLRFGKTKNFLSRQISGYSILLLLFILTIVVSLVVQAFFRNKFYSAFSLNLPYYSYTPKISLNIFVQFLFTSFVILFYYEFGFTFGNLMKGNPVAILIISIYVLLIPPFFKYDIANVFNNFGKEIFAFIGAYRLAQLKDIHLLIGGLELIGILFALIICNIIITKKRSAYV